MSQGNSLTRLSGYKAFLDNAITQQREAEKLYRVHAYTVVAIGVIVIIVGFALGGSLTGETFKWFLTIGGGFISALSVFPIKQILDRRERITGLGFLKMEFEVSENDTTQAGAERFTFAEQRLRQYLDAILGTGK